jgi:hypothetical protein
MLDLRYHLASLAAVFVAVALGILLGVALSGKVSDSTDEARIARIDDLEAQLEEERARTKAAGERSVAAQELVTLAYPALVDGRLAGRHFALVFLGPIDPDLRSDVQRALLDADAGFPIRTLALELPLDPAALRETLAGDDELAVYADESHDFADLGRDLGRELVLGGETPLWAALDRALVEVRSGSASVPADGLVVVDSRSAPEPGNVEAAERARVTATLVSGLLDGAKATGFPVVGIEESGTPSERSDVAGFRAEGISSVDAVDTVYGRIALTVLLEGGSAGHYGLSEDAEAVSPAIRPVEPQPGGP